MKDKDAKLLEESYQQISEVNRNLSIKDETSIKPQNVFIKHNNDGTVTIKFGLNYTLSHIDKENLSRLTVALSHTLEDMGTNIHRPTYN